MLKMSSLSQVWWLMPVILTAWETDIRRNVIPGQPGVKKTL
jgi:hypothetical protein